MHVEAIADPEDSRLIAYRDVKDVERHRRSDGFLVEGRKLLAPLIDADDYEVASVLISDSAFREVEDELAKLPPGTPVYRVTPAVAEEVAGVRFHQGCIAAARRIRVYDGEILLQRCAERSTVVALERVSDPDNVGSIFRSAYALGIEAVLLSPGCAPPLYRKSIRTSMGAVLRLPFGTLDAWPDELNAWRKEGFELLALDPSELSLGIDDFVSASARRVILLGTEGDGLTYAARELSDVSLRIPMVRGADSLNVGAAAAIAFHRLSPL